jgi:parallel beta-helix repeat protein
LSSVVWPSLVRLVRPVRALQDSKTIYVDVGNVGDPEEDGSWEHPFDRVQEGIDAAGFDDTVHVASGIYYEEAVINKSSISLVGENGGAVIDGNGTGYGLWIGRLPPNYAENVSLIGFTVRNCFRGITLVRCRYAFFRNNSLIDNLYGFADFSLQVNDIDTSNTVDGKPMYVWVGQRDRQVPADAGYVEVMNSVNVTVKDLNLTSNGEGVLFKNTTGSVVQNVFVSNNWDGICLDLWSRNNTIVGNTVSNNYVFGVYLCTSSSNKISGNIISENLYGVFLETQSGNNTIVDNTIEKNKWGVYLNDVSSNSNIIYHNNFVNNTVHAKARDAESVDTWDYGAEGNYWSGYMSEDVDSDGIGDAPYVIDENNQDNYPLMGFFRDFSVVWGEEIYHVTTICGFVISEFRFSQSDKLIAFSLTSPSSVGGFCRVAIPQFLLGGPYKIFVDDFPTAILNEKTNGTHAFLCFSFNQTSYVVEIEGTTVIREFSFSIVMVFVVTSIIIVWMCRRVRKFRCAGKIEDWASRAQSTNSFSMSKRLC